MQWRRVAAWAMLALVGTASAQQAPRPIGWPADVCVAEGVQASNPLCGTCSTSVIYSTPELGTYIGWVCRWPDGVWRTHELTRPFGSRWHVPTSATIAAMWDANAIAPDAAETARYAALIAIARPHLASVWRPPEPVAAAWIVAPVSTRLRPSYLMIDGAAVRETGRYIQTGTADAPTGCACPDVPAITATQLCPVPNFVTTSGQTRYASCTRK